ncbi:hypothetical protein KIPB_007800, partial [Kipferlia bialata]
SDDVTLPPTMDSGNGAETGPASVNIYPASDAGPLQNIEAQLAQYTVGEGNSMPMDTAPVHVSVNGTQDTDMQALLKRLTSLESLPSQLAKAQDTIAELKEQVASLTSNQAVLIHSAKQARDREKERDREREREKHSQAKEGSDTETETHRRVISPLSETMSLHYVTPFTWSNKYKGQDFQIEKSGLRALKQHRTGWEVVVSEFALLPEDRVSYFQVLVEKCVKGMYIGVVAENGLERIDLDNHVGSVAGVTHDYWIHSKGAVYSSMGTAEYTQRWSSGTTVGVILDPIHGKIGFVVDGSWCGWAMGSLPKGVRYRPAVSFKSQSSILSIGTYKRPSMERRE